MNNTSIDPPETEQPNPTRDDLLALGLKPVAAYVLPDRPKRASNDAARACDSRESRKGAGRVRVEGWPMADHAPAFRILYKASVTGSFDKTLKTLANGYPEEFEYVTGHIEVPAPGLELWIPEMLCMPVPTPPVQTSQPARLPLSREHRIGAYVLQLTGWRRWVAELAFWQPTNRQKVKPRTARPR